MNSSIPADSALRVVSKPPVTKTTPLKPNSERLFRVWF